MEFGVGNNTPIIIKYPFEKMTYLNDKTNLIRFNNEQAFCPKEIEKNNFI